MQKGYFSEELIQADGADPEEKPSCPRFCGLTFWSSLMARCGVLGRRVPPRDPAQPHAGPRLTDFTVRWPKAVAELFFAISPLAQSAAQKPQETREA